MGPSISINTILALSHKGEFRFIIHDANVTAPIFKTFLQRLLVGASNPVFVVVDGYPMTVYPLVQQHIESQEGQIKLYILPPYSQQLIPFEQVWTHVKRRVNRKLVQAKDEMNQFDLGILHRIKKMINLVRFFISHNQHFYDRIKNYFRELINNLIIKNAK